MLSPAHSYYSKGYGVVRELDYQCQTVNNADAANTCDSGGANFAAMDGQYNDKCMVGARCNPGGPSNGGCGTNAKCSAVLQLPTPKSYTKLRTAHIDGVWTDPTITELELQAGSYSMCVCDNNNGNGGCDDTDEWTIVTNPDSTIEDPLDSNSQYAGELKVIERPRLGLDTHLASVRHVQNRSHQYQIIADCMIVAAPAQPVACVPSLL